MNRINYKLGLILFSVFISLLLNIKANAQKLRWALPPNQVNFNSSPVVHLHLLRLLLHHMLPLAAQRIKTVHCCFG